MPTSRRQFLGSAVVSSAVIALYGPGALARAAVASDEARVAGRVLDAVSLAPFNDLTPRDWTAFAEQRLSSGAAGERPAFAALKETRPEFAGLSPQEAADRLVRLLLPNYQGPQSMSRQEWMAEVEAQRKAIAGGPDVDVPAETGKFNAEPASATQREKIMIITPAAQLRAARVSSRVLESANVLVARPDLEAKDGLAVQI